jgi:hypothetical protein
MRTVPNMYLLSLAISDIIYLTAVFSNACLDNATWPRGDIVCSFLPFCNRMSFGLTMNFVTVLYIRYYKLKANPFHVRVSSLPTWLATAATIFGVWLLAAFFAIPAARSQYMCANSILLWRIYYHQYIIVFQMLVSLVIPAIMITFFVTYGMCFGRNLSSLSEETQISRLNKIKYYTGLSFSFTVVAWCYHIVEFCFYSKISLEFFSFQIGVVIVSDYNVRDIIFILQILLSIKSCLNPVALCFTSLAFRRHFKRYLTCRSKTNSTPNDVELTLIN